jgi:ATP-binding cassette subfamily C protein CydCD
MAATEPTAAVIAVLTLPLIPVLGALIGWATERRARAAWTAQARLAGHFLDVVRGLPTLRVFGRAHRQTAVVRQMTDRHRHATVRVLRLALVSSAALDLVATLSVGLIAVEAGLRVAAGTLALGPALLVILLAPEVYRPLREVAARFHASADASAVIGDVDEVLAPPGAAAPAGCFRRAAGRPALSATPLRVRHPGAAADALELAGLAVRDRELVALRGPSGAGKTTALRVLAGLQPATTGRVQVTGPDPLYLPQRPTLPHARTVADVFPGLAPDEVRSALRTVGLADEVAPDTLLGEHGAGVSAGQRQRLALAALLRAAGREPAVLLLDEPTAHLDEHAERLVIAQLRAAAAGGCAVLVVAHRPALLAAAGRVIDVRTPQPVEAVEAVEAIRSVPQPVEALPSRPQPAAGYGSAGSADAAGRAPRRLGRIARGPGAAVALGSASWLAGIVLTGAAAWLLVRAAALPPVLTLSTAVVLVRGSAVARPLLRYLERLVAHDVAFARLGSWRSRVFADLIPRMPGPRSRRRGDLLTRVGDDVDARVDGLLRGRLPGLAAGVALTVVAITAVLVLPAVAFPLVAGLAVGAILAPALAVRQAARTDAATARATGELRDAVVETIDGLEELAVRERDTGSALAVPDRRSRALARLAGRWARSAGAAAAVGRLGWGLAVTGTALVAGDGGLAHEWAAVLLLAIVALGEPLAELPDAAVARHRARTAAKRLARIATQPTPGTLSSAGPSTARPSPGRPASAEAATARPSPGRPPSAGASAAQPPPARAAVATSSTGGRRAEDGDIVVRGLVAGWDPDRPPALRGVDLDLPAGSRIAVLGPSGGGKSTLAAVLAGLLDPRAGTVTGRGRTVLVGDGTDHVFASTVRENLRLARPGATDGEVHAALARAGLGAWLAGLPDGLDTWLGTGGGTVSGGQRRRLATARALLADPVLLILDEPTEGLDEVGAEELMADLLAAAAGRTVLLLTHRTEGLDRVDARYELRAGTLTAAGQNTPVVVSPAPELARQCTSRGPVPSS